jgi:hypothetical protein
MRVIVVPYFTGTPIDPLETPPPDRILTPELPDGSKQERMAVLYRDLTTAVAGAVHDAEVPIVCSSDGASRRSSTVPACGPSRRSGRRSSVPGTSIPARTMPWQPRG